MVTPQIVVIDSLDILRAAGRARVRRRLESLVNSNMLGLAGAQRVYRAAFGGELIAVKDKQPSFNLGHWFTRTNTTTENPT